MKIVPREYQKLATKSGLKGLRSRQKRALVVLATGLGKTFTAAFIAKEFGAKRILFLVHNNFILDHAQREFKQVFNGKTKFATYNGMEKNGAGKADIVFSTWQTMGSNLDSWTKDYFDLIIVDEAHHSEADTYRPVLKYFRAAKLGITATPDRSDKADIREVFGDPVIDVTLEEAIARGWLPRIEYHVITDESLNDEVLQEVVADIREGKRFTMTQVNRRIFIRKRDEEVARIINGYSEKAIVFCSSTKYADRMAGLLDLGASFHSKRGESQKGAWNQNQETLDKLKNGLVRRVCAVNAFNEGVNVPSIGLVAFCRVTEALTIFRQQLGRGLRPGKDKLIVLDFVGNLERIQLVLRMMNKISDLHEKFTPKEEIEREGYVRQSFEVSGKGFEFTFSDNVVDLMEVLRHCDEDFYPTWQEASEAAIKLGIKNVVEYQQEKKYKLDSRLVSNPFDKYADFPGWIIYLGRTDEKYYKTWQEAGMACKKIGIKSKSDYRRRYSEDSRLPSNPYREYQDFPGTNVFLGTIPQQRVINPYKTLEKAKIAVKKLRIKNREDYISKRAEDPKLPSKPEITYKNFSGWKDFLGTVFYKKCIDASIAAQKLEIKTKEEYRLKRSQDPKLYAAPENVYPDFPGWAKFLGKK